MRHRPGLKALLLVCGLAVTATACEAVSGRETTGEYVDDATITAKVKAAILDEPTLKSMEISVETFQDAVQLSGFVDSQGSRTKAGQLARGVSGVRSVKNDLVVR